MSGLTTQQVAARLGVKVDTVYAYVSRGVLTASHQPGSRISHFDAGEVEALARRGRPRRNSRPAALDIIVESGLTSVHDGALYFRGRDACRLARELTFEQTATWLWTGQEPPGSHDSWDPYDVTLPPLSETRDRIRAAVVLAAPLEPFRADLSATAATTTGRALIATMVQAAGAGQARIPRLRLTDGPPIPHSIAGRLWTGLTPRRPQPGLVSALNAALVLLTDHELASSTVAARVAASVRSDPFGVVLAGLGPLSGPLHGGASARVHALLAAAMATSPERAVAIALQEGRGLPGFGHPLYPDGDPRGALLLELVGAASPEAPAVSVSRAVAAAARRHADTEPTVDYALAVLSLVAGMGAGAGETIFTAARTAGWIAHAIEEYAEAPLRFRARAVPRVGI